MRLRRFLMTEPTPSPSVTRSVLDLAEVTSPAGDPGYPPGDPPEISRLRTTTAGGSRLPPAPEPGTTGRPGPPAECRRGPVGRPSSSTRASVRQPRPRSKTAARPAHQSQWRWMQAYDTRLLTRRRRLPHRRFVPRVHYCPQ